MLVLPIRTFIYVYEHRLSKTLHGVLFETLTMNGCTRCHQLSSFFARTCQCWILIFWNLLHFQLSGTVPITPIYALPPPAPPTILSYPLIPAPLGPVPSPIIRPHPKEMVRLQPRFLSTLQFSFGTDAQETQIPKTKTTTTGKTAQIQISL